MNKTKKLQKSKIAHERARLKKQKEVAEQAELFEEQEGQDELAPEGVEELSKDYYGTKMAMPMMGPQTFEELDAMETAREQAEQVRKVTWSVQDLVWNILNDPMSGPDEKETKIKAVASGFKSRVVQAASGVKKDIDLLEVEAILATDSRHTGVLEKVGNFIKETLSSSARENLADSDFALPEKRKYPIHDKAHVRNALARAAQQMKAGGEAAADAKAAMPKIRAAAKKFGIDMSMEKGIHIEKDAKGDWRWIGRPTNNFIDWQTDIISKGAHQKYITWLDANPEFAPVFMPWHTPEGVREHPVDFWMEQDGAVIMSGVLTEPEAAALFEVQKEVDLGMSFQAMGLRLDADPRVITDYWMYEVSDLPLDRAANPFTSLETMTKEVGMEKLEYLTKIMGSEEKAKAYLEKTSQAQKDLADAGITSKEKVEEPVKEPETEPIAAPPAVPGLDIAAIVKAVGEQMDLEGLNAFVAQAQTDHEKVEILEELIKDLKTTKEDDLVEALTPPVSRFAWSQGKRASQSDSTKIKKEDEKDEKLSKSAPGVQEDYWLSKATNTAPISIETS